MAPDPPFERVDIAGVPVSRVSVASLIDWAAARASRRDEPALVCYANAAAICLARDDPAYARALRERAAVCYADGQAVVWASRLLDRALPERVNAGDFWPALLRRLAAQGASVYLIGGEEGLAEQAARRLTAVIPALKIAGAAGGYFRDEQDAATAAEAIHAAAPAVVFAGMGAPRQELWAARRLETIGAPLVWCVGALFEYYAGRRARAPRWARRWGLEWAFRLALEPRRLGRRYLVGNPRFLYLVARQWAARDRGTKS
jgi:exopolysaccharide biosynthesis WecB/TagA/CpsF family protein